jgi:protein-tyrosine-phosphatase
MRLRGDHARDNKHDPENHAPTKKSLMAAPLLRAPQAVLFACGFNSVRSPMAESLLQQMFPHALYVRSAGVKKGELDPFAVAVMAELGQNISQHKPMTFEELDDWEGLNFDLIITLSPEAHHKALALTHRLAAQVEYWPTADPADVEGNRAQRLDAYRAVRDQLLERIRSRFP